MTKSPLVAIAVLNWNNAADTVACLESIAQLEYDNYDVLVIDNGSTDGSVETIRARFPTVEILALSTNLGYAAGNNAGIEHCLQHGADYVFILNNDTLIAPSLLRELVDIAEANPAAGMVGPTMYCTDPATTLYAAGSFVDWSAGLLHHRGMFALPGLYTEAGVPEPVDFIVGCGLLVTRKLIEQIGAFDPQYYLNFEDVEWGTRARRHGFQVLYAPRAIMWHKVSATLGQASPANTYYMTRNGLLFFWKNAPPQLRWLAITRIMLRTLRSVAAWSVKTQYRSPAFRRKRSANVLAVRDFILQRFGAMGADVQRICYGK